MAKVVVLVVMESGLKVEKWRECYCFEHSVVVLVVMESGLKDIYIKSFQCALAVVVLVVMESGLKNQKTLPGKGSGKS